VIGLQATKKESREEEACLLPAITPASTSIALPAVEPAPEGAVSVVHRVGKLGAHGMLTVLTAPILAVGTGTLMETCEREEAPAFAADLPQFNLHRSPPACARAPARGSRR
jgi:hypothetical protein